MLSLQQRGQIDWATHPFATPKLSHHGMPHDVAKVPVTVGHRKFPNPQLAVSNAAPWALALCGTYPWPRADVQQCAKLEKDAGDELAQCCGTRTVRVATCPGRHVT